MRNVIKKQDLISKANEKINLFLQTSTVEVSTFEQVSDLISQNGYRWERDGNQWHAKKLAVTVNSKTYHIEDSGDILYDIFLLAFYVFGGQDHEFVKPKHDDDD